MDLQDRLLRQAADSLEYEPTEEEIAEGIEEQLKVMQAQLAQQGLSLEMYCSFMNTTEEQLRQDARPDAVASIRAQAAIELIVDLEQLEATKEDLEEALALICRQNNMTMEQMQPYYDAQFEAAVTRSVLTTKVMQLIRDNAQIESN